MHIWYKCWSHPHSDVHYILCVGVSIFVLSRKLKYCVVDPVCDWNNSKKELLGVRWPVQRLMVAKISKKMVTFPKYHPRYSWEIPLIPKPPDYFGDSSLTKAISRKYLKQRCSSELDLQLSFKKISKAIFKSMTSSEDTCQVYLQA